MRSALIFTPLLIIGCGKKPGSYEITNASEDAQVDQLQAQAEALWLERGDKEQLLKAMEVYEQLFAQNPENKDIAVKLVRGWYFYGDAFETEVEAKRSAWDKAITFGEKCLSLNPEFSTQIAEGTSKEEAASTLVSTDVPCAYWTASALGKWAKAGGLAVTLKHIGTAKAYISQVESLEPTYFHGAVHRYWGAYYAGLPSFAGQDLERSQTEFKKSMEISPDYLGTRVLYADYWATKNQDQIAIFDEMLQYVMQVNLDALDPELRPENEAEKRKAEALWAMRSDKFLDAPEPAALSVELPQPKPEVLEEQEVEEAPATEEGGTEATEEPATEAEGTEAPTVETEAAE